MSRKVNEATVEEWKVLLESCDSRPKEMNLDAWCKEAGVSKSNYYYWKRRIKKAKEPDDDEPKPVIVRIDSDTLQRDQEDHVDIDFHDLKIRVTNRTPMELLSRVIEVIRDA